MGYTAAQQAAMYFARKRRRWAADTPLLLGSSLLAWWDASHGVTLNGSTVSAWADRKNGHTVEQATAAARPAFSASGFNGAPGLTFDGSDDELTLASQPFPSGANPVELWAVVQQDALVADTSNRNVIAYGGLVNTDLRTLRRRVDGGANQLAGGIGNGATIVIAPETTVDFSGRHVVRVSVGAAASQASIDGIAGAETAVVPATGTTRVRIGANTADTAAGFWHGKMRDVIVTAPLTDKQAALLLAFLMDRSLR